MPKLETDGFYDAVIETAGFNLEYKSFECTAKTADGYHVYPTLYLENKGGSENKEAFDKLQAIFGWSGSDGDELIQKAVGKTIRVGVKKKENKDGYYYNFCAPSERKQKVAAPAADVNSWLGKLRKTDLSIPESGIPF